jgi:tyrosyl-tRNA synthetase
MAATGANEPSKAELARAEFAAAIAATTASVEALMVGEGELTSGEKYALCRSIGEECIQEQELFNLLDKKPEIIGTYSIAGSLGLGLGDA